MLQTGQKDPYRTFDIGFNNGRFAKVVKFRYNVDRAQWKNVVNKSLTLLNYFDRGRNTILISGARPKIDDWSASLFKGIVRAAASTDSVILSNGLGMLPQQVPKNVQAIGIAAEAQVRCNIITEKTDEMVKRENNPKAT